MTYVPERIQWQDIEGKPEPEAVKEQIAIQVEEQLAVQQEVSGLKLADPEA